MARDAGDEAMARRADNAANSARPAVRRRPRSGLWDDTARSASSGDRWLDSSPPVLCRARLSECCEVICADSFFCRSKKQHRPHFELLRSDITFPLYVELDRISSPAGFADPLSAQPGTGDENFGSRLVPTARREDQGCTDLRYPRIFDTYWTEVRRVNPAAPFATRPARVVRFNPYPASRSFTDHNTKQYGTE